VHFSTGQVSRVDAASEEVTSLRVGSGPLAIAAGNLSDVVDDDEYFLWVTNTTSETLSEIDAGQPDRGASTQALQFRPGGIAYADGFLWIIDSQAEAVSQRTADRLQPGAGPVSVGAGPVGIVAGGGAVWVSNELGQSLSRINATTGTADAPISLDFVPGAIALDVETASLWVIDTDGDRVVRWDTGTRREVTRVDVGRRPVAVAVGAGSVWVANSTDGSVSRIDPATNAVSETILVGGAPVGITVMDTTVWVAVAES
jgi:YVTN family beta-propeller protein